MVGNKRLGRRAAGNRVHHRCFHFEITLAHHVVAHGLDDFAAFDKGVARFGADDQVHITLAVFDFLVGQAFVFVGQRAQRFGQQADIRHAHGQLAVVGFEQCAFRADDVAHVPMFEIFVRRFAYALIVDVKLDLAAHVLNGGETRFAHRAFEHHAPRDFDGDFLRVECFFREGIVFFVQLAREAVALEIVGEGDALLADGMQFFAAQGDNLVFVELGFGGGGLVFGHIVCLIKNRQLQLPDGGGVYADFTRFFFFLKDRPSENTAVRPVSFTKIIRNH